MSATTNIRQFAAGEVIFSENDICDGVYIVTSGLVQIYCNAGSDGKGALELAQVGKGGMFGEMSVIDLQGRSAGAKALQSSTLVHISSGEFSQSLQQLPLWSLLLIQMLVRRLRQTNEELTKYASPACEMALYSKISLPEELVPEEKINPEDLIKDLGDPGQTS